MRDKSISEAVELLYKGAKMLAYHCDECRMPLFQYEGKIMCPSCKKLFKINDNGMVEPLQEKKDEKLELRKVESPNYHKAREIIKMKLLDLILKMNDCKSVDCLNNLIDLSIKLLIILEKLNKEKF